ncbi:hypothetical protein HJFPF1_08771 [Paramyrothecium foliicola]|nr:hypothetical protein HJFPF1_08771 [Paramyrothecium foliicola]
MYKHPGHLPVLAQTGRARRGEVTLLELLLDDLPPAEGHLLVDGRDAAAVQAHVGQLLQVAAQLERLDELGGGGLLGSEGEQVLDSRGGAQLGVGDEVAGELVEPLSELRGEFILFWGQALGVLDGPAHRTQAFAHRNSVPAKRGLAVVNGDGNTQRSVQVLAGALSPGPRRPVQPLLALLQREGLDKRPPQVHLDDILVVDLFSAGEALVLALLAPVAGLLPPTLQGPDVLQIFELGGGDVVGIDVCDFALDGGFGSPGRKGEPRVASGLLCHVAIVSAMQSFVRQARGPGASPFHSFPRTHSVLRPDAGAVVEMVRVAAARGARAKDEVDAIADWTDRSPVRGDIRGIARVEVGMLGFPGS